jgi:predicted alpha/beta-fold hydrolase
LNSHIVTVNDLNEFGAAMTEDEHGFTKTHRQSMVHVTHGTSNGTVPPFEPHPWVRGGDAQTIVARYLPGPRIRLPTTAHEIDAGAGDRLSVLESVPAGSVEDAPAAVLVHGLGGDAGASYIVRVAWRLFSLGIRVVRMNLRGAGMGFGLARGFYHAGRSDDARAVVEWLAGRVPGAPIALLGFSLGGNIVLKLAAEAARRPVPGLDCVLAANPPIDLAACCRYLQRPRNRMYDRNFVKLLQAEVRRLHRARPELGPVDLSRATTLFDFDDVYTAPRNGFADALDYYQQSSAGPRLAEITIPGLVIHAADDPFIPVEPFQRFPFPSGLALELIPSGGHLGYFSRRRWGGDRRWLDGRLSAWLAVRWAERLRENVEARPIQRPL